MSGYISTGIVLDFEGYSKSRQSGTPYWHASDFYKMLGYSSLSSFKKVIDRVDKAFIGLNIDRDDHIKRVETSNGKDYELTRFACYLLAMNGDTKKKEVAYTQKYFAEQTRKFQLYVQGREDVERFSIREEVKDGNKALSQAARNSGVSDYAKFTNAGYLGLYNSFNWELAKKRGIPKEKLFDYMGRTELAANLFRATLTEARLNKENKEYGVIGQEKSEQIHKVIAQNVRNQIKENTGKYPEELPVEKRLPELKKILRK